MSFAAHRIHRSQIRALATSEAVKLFGVQAGRQDKREWLLETLRSAEKLRRTG
jgi:hypothetical protein